MGFRQDKQDRLKWKKWLQHSRDILGVECALPADVYEERRNWLYFLGHASLWAPGRPHWFCLDKLTPSQMRRLAEFLSAEGKGEAEDPYVLIVLKGALGLPQRFRPPPED